MSRFGETVLAVAAVCVLGSGAAAQRRGVSAGYPAAEIGTQAVGVTWLSQSGNTSTFFGLPGPEVLAQPSIYAALFLSPVIALEPTVTYQHISSEGSSSWAGAALLRLGGYFSGAGQNSPFLFGDLGVRGSGSDSHSDSHAGFGLGGGYRWLVADGRLALRLEGRVRRWAVDPDVTEIGVVLAGGIVVGRGR